MTPLDDGNVGICASPGGVVACTPSSDSKRAALSVCAVNGDPNGHCVAGFFNALLRSSCESCTSAGAAVVLGAPLPDDMFWFDDAMCNNNKYTVLFTTPT